MKLRFLMLLSFLTLLVLSGCTEHENTDKKPTPTTPKIPEIIEYDDIAPSADMCDDIEDQGAYKLVWCDEFNYKGLPDRSKWKYDVGGGGWGNNELQYYKQYDRDNVKVENDNLVITALKENFGENHYTSTRLLTAGKADFLYGKVEVRAKLPVEGGTWPAIWMLGSNIGSAGWPQCGEIDIMEHVANNLNVIHGSVHTTNYNHKENTQKTDHLVLDSVNDYHVYSIEWTEQQIRFFIDNIHYFTFNNDETTNPDNSKENWPFDERMFMILNVAIGGWGGTVEPNFESASMYIDYVRVYQREQTETDTESPTDVTNLTVTSTSPTKTEIAWDASNDDKGVKLYQIYRDDILVGTTDIPRYTFTDLLDNTTYKISVEAMDFSNHFSNKVALTFETSSYPSIPGRIEAEDYIQMEGIDTETTTDDGGGINVGWLDTNDLLEYKISVPMSGYYTVSYRIAGQSPGGKLGLYTDETLLQETEFTATGGWQNWVTVESSEFYLESGVHTLKVKIVQSGFNINWMEFNLNE